MTNILRLIGVGSAILIITFVLVMIRRKNLTDEYATLWLTTSLIFLFGAIFAREIFKFYSLLKGPAGSGLGILLFLAIIMIVFLLIIISSKLSVHQEQIKMLTQKLGLYVNDTKKPEN